jgi:hypothetical protein
MEHCLTGTFVKHVVIVRGKNSFISVQLTFTFGNFSLFTKSILYSIGLFLRLKLN